MDLTNFVLGDEAIDQGVTRPAASHLAVPIPGKAGIAHAQQGHGTRTRSHHSHRLAKRSPHGVLSLPGCNALSPDASASMKAIVLLAGYQNNKEYFE
jgi:hypothetical protein